MRRIAVCALLAAALLAAPGAAHPQDKALTIRWYGQSFFLLTTAAGTRIALDPFGSIGFPMPADVQADAVTITHNHVDHNNPGLIKGSPEVLRGLTADGKDWTRIDQKVKDVRIYTVPSSYHDAEQGGKRGRNAIFVYEVDGLRLAHLGDLGTLLSPPQLQQIGAVDILFIPVCGRPFTIGPEEATQVVEQVKPRVAIPMHYKTPARPDWPGKDEKEFVAGKPNVRRLGGHTLTISKATLPATPQVVVMGYQEGGSQPPPLRTPSR